MPKPLDTPARAARARRPQTRAWRRLLSDAVAQDESAVAIRRKLRMHLDSADRLALKRRPSTLAAEPALNPLQVLHSLETDWNERVAALESLRAKPTTHELGPVAPWLAKQLGDLRSKVVVAASDAVAAVAAVKLFSAEQASELFSAAAGGVSVSKKVMADARRAAALAVLNGQTDGSLFDAVAAVAKGSPHTAARRLALDALVEAVDNAAKAVDLATQVTDVLAVGAIDRAVEVREGARELAKMYQKRFGDDEWNNVKLTLPTDAAARLASMIASTPVAGGKNAGPAAKAKGLAARNGRPTMKELIRQRREAMKNQNAERAGDGQETAKKRSSEDSKLEGRRDSAKRGAFITLGKENMPTGM